MRYHAEHIMTSLRAQGNGRLDNAVIAFGNYWLAKEEDLFDLQAAVNPDIAIELYEEGACWEGMRAVGMRAKSWEHLGLLIEEADRVDWLRWCIRCWFEEVEDGCSVVFVERAYQEEEDE